jgi:hypothetical protein
MLKPWAGDRTGNLRIPAYREVAELRHFASHSRNTKATVFGGL